jgi:hypothetical protein
MQAKTVRASRGRFSRRLAPWTGASRSLLCPKGILPRDQIELLLADAAKDQGAIAREKTRLGALADARHQRAARAQERWGS